MRTISQLLSALSKPEPLTPKKLAKHAKEGRVAKMVEQLSQWLRASAKYVDDLPAQWAPAEKLKKIAQIARQLSEQQSQLSQVKRVVGRGQRSNSKDQFVPDLGTVQRGGEAANRRVGEGNAGTVGPNRPGKAGGRGAREGTEKGTVLDEIEGEM